MIPRRFRNWLLIWTPVTWLVLELCTYPKDRPVIIDPQIYPPDEVPDGQLLELHRRLLRPDRRELPGLGHGRRCAVVAILVGGPRARTARARRG